MGGTDNKTVEITTCFACRQAELLTLETAPSAHAFIKCKRKPNSFKNAAYRQIAVKKGRRGNIVPYCRKACGFAQCFRLAADTGEPALDSFFARA